MKIMEQTMNLESLKREYDELVQMIDEIRKSSRNYWENPDLLKKNEANLKRLLELSQLIGKEKYIEVLIYCGNFYKYASWACENEEDCLEYFQKALQLQIELTGEINPVVANIYNKIGCYYNNNDDSFKALEYFKKECAIQEKIEPVNLENLTVSYHNFAMLSKRLEDYETAIEYYKKYLSLVENSGSQDSIDDTYFDLAYSYDVCGDKENALVYYLKVTECNNECDKSLAALAWKYIAFIYIEAGKNNKALNAFKKALELDNQGSFGMEIYENLISLYIEEDDNYQAAKTIIRAIDNIDLNAYNAESVKQQYEDLAYELSGVLESKADILKDEGNAALAKQYGKMVVKLSDKLEELRQKWEEYQDGEDFD